MTTEQKILLIDEMILRDRNTTIKTYQKELSRLNRINNGDDQPKFDNGKYKIK